MVPALPPRSRLRVSSSGHIEEKVSDSTIVVKNSFLHFMPKRSLSERVRSQSCPPSLASAPKPPITPFAPIPSSLEESVTTVMARNIPTRFTSISLLRVLDDAGFAGTYSFFYLPMDFRTGKNMGYCFINFLFPDLAHMFANIFNGTRLGLTSSSKVLQVGPSRRQGLKDNVALFRGSDLLSSYSLPYFKPFVLVYGELLPLCHYLFDTIMSLPE